MSHFKSPPPSPSSPQTASTAPPRPPTPRAPEQTALPAIDRDAPSVELRLAIGKDGLGIELGRDARVGCIDVTELVVHLPGMRFPLDVSGGVSRFRHRRGELRRIAIELHARAVAEWVAPKLRGIVSAASPDVWIAVRRGGATVGIASRESAAVLAFELTIDTHEGDVCLSITRPRGSALAAPPTQLAIAAMKAALGNVALRAGARFSMGSAILSLARAVLPEAGARAPSVDGVRWSVVTAHADRWILHASHGAVQAEPDEAATRAREANALTCAADDVRATGDLARARALDVESLERAPRHGEIAARIAEIDARSGDRAEAAYATLLEAGGDAYALLRAELLAEIGDRSGAVASFVHAGEGEAAPALAARAFERAAELTRDPLDALVWLDHAVARAPAIARIRWARISRRLEAGRIEEALADVGHVEAMTTGARAKHTVWRRAGDAWRTAGRTSEASTLFERALRYLPEDPEALAGLGESLVAEGKAARGAALLARAIEIAETKSIETSAMVLALARALADAAMDRPAAIARARTIPSTAREALDARALEGRWRAALGDHAGAALAFARMRDLAAARAESTDAQATPSMATAAAYLREAAQFEHTTRGDALAAQRHLGCALRLAPHDREIEREYRAICSALAPAPAPLPALVDAPAPELDEATAAARVETLARTLQNDPSRDDVVDELATHLVRLGRSLELLALLSARLEESTPERRTQLLPAQRAVLERLEQESRAAGRTSEADLFRDARNALF